MLYSSVYNLFALIGRKAPFSLFYSPLASISPFSTTRVLSPFRGGGIAYLNDPNSYAGWSFYTPVRATQARQVEE